MKSSKPTQPIKSLSPPKNASPEVRLEVRCHTSVEHTSPHRAERYSAPLSFAQERLWATNRLEPESPVDTEAMAIRFQGSLNVAALRNALDTIVDRHEVLRTTFFAPKAALRFSQLDNVGLLKSPAEEPRPKPVGIYRIQNFLSADLSPIPKLIYGISI